MQLERANNDELEQEISLRKQQVRKVRQEMGGINAAQENNELVLKQVKILESRLHKSLIKFNEALSCVVVVVAAAAAHPSSPATTHTRPPLDGSRPLVVLLRRTQTCGRTHAHPHSAPCSLRAVAASTARSFTLRCVLHERSM